MLSTLGPEHRREYHVFSGVACRKAVRTMRTPQACDVALQQKRGARAAMAGNARVSAFQVTRRQHFSLFPAAGIPPRPGKGKNPAHRNGTRSAKFKNCRAQGVLSRQSALVVGLKYCVRSNLPCDNVKDNPGSPAKGGRLLDFRAGVGQAAFFFVNMAGAAPGAS